MMERSRMKSVRIRKRCDGECGNLLSAVVHEPWWLKNYNSGKVRYWVRPERRGQKILLPGRTRRRERKREPLKKKGESIGN